MASAMMASRIRHSTRNCQTMCLPWRQKVLISSPLQRLPKTSFQPSSSVPFRNWTGGNTGKTFNIYTCILLEMMIPIFGKGGVVYFDVTTHILFSAFVFHERVTFSFHAHALQATTTKVEFLFFSLLMPKKVQWTITIPEIILWVRKEFRFYFYDPKKSLMTLHILRRCLQFYFLFWKLLIILPCRMSMRIAYFDGNLLKLILPRVWWLSTMTWCIHR